MIIDLPSPCDVDPASSICYAALECQEMTWKTITDMEGFVRADGTFAGVNLCYDDETETSFGDVDNGERQAMVTFTEPVIGLDIYEDDTSISGLQFITDNCNCMHAEFKFDDAFEGVLGNWPPIVYTVGYIGTASSLVDWSFEYNKGDADALILFDTFPDSAAGCSVESVENLSSVNYNCGGMVGFYQLDVCKNDPSFQYIDQETLKATFNDGSVIENSGRIWNQSPCTFDWA